MARIGAFEANQASDSLLGREFRERLYFVRRSPKPARSSKWAAKS